MASSPITSWQTDGGKMGTMSDCIFFGSKITADGDYRHKIKRCLLLGRRPITNLESILKSRDIVLLTRVRIVKTMFFPVIMYRCEIWTIKKAEHRKIDAFDLWCWRRLLSILGPVNPKGKHQSYIGRADAEGEAPTLWPLDVNNQLTRKDPDAGED